MYGIDFNLYGQTSLINYNKKTTLSNEIQNLSPNTQIVIVIYIRFCNVINEMTSGAVAGVDGYKTVAHTYIQQLFRISVTGPHKAHLNLMLLCS